MKRVVFNFSPAPRMRLRLQRQRLKSSMEHQDTDSVIAVVEWFHPTVNPLGAEDDGAFVWKKALDHQSKQNHAAKRHRNGVEAVIFNSEILEAASASRKVHGIWKTVPMLTRIAKRR